MRRGKYGILFYTSTVASMLLAFQLASATSIVAPLWKWRLFSLLVA